MEKQEILSLLPEVLLPWYAQNKRNLPWRQDHDPYHIWVSEIMLQQTRVEAVKGYYTRFLNTLPTVAELAAVDDEQLQKLWEGLGYYSRMRNLKKAAGVIVDSYGGKFPTDYESVLGLPGIGEYTAGAICSIAYDQPVPAVDGNVLRVASRLLNDSTPIERPSFKKMVRAELSGVYPDRAGDFTQSLIELGATVCGPNREPDCENCPCHGFCRAYREGAAKELPVRLPKRKRRQEEKTVFILSCDRCYGIQKRTEKGVLSGLWQFPNTEGKLTVEAAMTFLEEKGLEPREIKMTVERKHIFTHIEWDMIGIYVEVNRKIDQLVWMDAQQINETTALPTAFRQFWEGLSYV